MRLVLISRLQPVCSCYGRGVRCCQIECPKEWAASWALKCQTLRKATPPAPSIVHACCIRCAGNDVGEHARDGRREVAPPPVGAAGQQAREGPGGAPQAGRAHPEASAAAPESQEVLLSPEVASALERVKALLLAVQGRASSVERVVQTLAEAISVSAQAPALSSPAGSAEDGPQLLELLSLPALLPESVDILLVEDQSTLASIDSMLTEVRIAHGMPRATACHCPSVSCDDHALPGVRTGTQGL